MQILYAVQYSKTTQCLVINQINGFNSCFIPVLYYQLCLTPQPWYCGQSWCTLCSTCQNNVHNLDGVLNKNSTHNTGFHRILPTVQNSSIYRVACSHVQVCVTESMSTMHWFIQICYVWVCSHGVVNNIVLFSSFLFFLCFTGCAFVSN